jgi:hypothetical protein
MATLSRKICLIPPPKSYKNRTKTSTDLWDYGDIWQYCIARSPYLRQRVSISIKGYGYCTQIIRNVATKNSGWRDKRWQEWKCGLRKTGSPNCGGAWRPDLAWVAQFEPKWTRERSSWTSPLHFTAFDGLKWAHMPSCCTSGQLPRMSSYHITYSLSNEYTWCINVYCSLTHNCNVKMRPSQ